LGDILQTIQIAPKSFGRYFSEKNAPNAKKIRPNGEILPNLVTLDEVHSKTSFFNIGLVDYPVNLLSCMYGELQGRYMKKGKAWGVRFRSNDRTYRIHNVRFHQSGIDVINFR
jgi:hypothetical protein